MNNLSSLNSSSYPLGLRAALAIKKISDIGCENEWGLTPYQIATLLGINNDLYLRLLSSAKKTGTIQLDAESYERASMLLGIYKSLSFIEPDQPGINFFNRPCTAFDGHSIKESLILDPSLENMQMIRGYLNAKRS